VRINSIFSLLVPKSQAQLEIESQRAVLRKEAEIGGTVFGPVPVGVRREFFCLDTHTWIWHEEWTDTNRQQHVRTTRYDIRPHGIFKAQDGQTYRPLTQDEAINLYFAVREYNKSVREYFIPRLAPGY